MEGIANNCTQKYHPLSLNSILKTYYSYDELNELLLAKSSYLKTCAVLVTILINLILII
jgi:hypothetical protein